MVRHFSCVVFRLILVVKSIQAKKSLLSHIQEIVGTLDPEHKFKTLEILVKIENDGFFGPEWLELFQRIILVPPGNPIVSLWRSKGLTRTGLKLNPKTSESLLIQVYSTLCRRLVQVKEIRTIILTIRCMSFLLEKKVGKGHNARKDHANSHGKPLVISQWHIDSTLSAISKKSSCIASVDPEGHAGLIFSSLCKLFNCMLVIHRMKLGGRYHLIISALQPLLQCLFVSYRKSEASVRTMSQPLSLGEVHAAAYGRLLTTICDPTVSAVTRPRKRSRHDLNDETKKARNIAGQHLQYLIMEYCNSQLKGRLRPEMKAALTPGLHAIFDVMSQDVMRTINAAMDSSSQSIFKALYEDYRRSGQWRGTG